MKLNIFFRLEKAWVGTRKKHVSSLNYVFCFGENLNLHYVKQNDKPTHAIDDIVYYIFLNICVILNFNFHSMYML